MSNLFSCYGVFLLPEGHFTRGLPDFASVHMKNVLFNPAGSRKCRNDQKRMMEHDGCAESSRYVKIEHDIEADQLAHRQPRHAGRSCNGTQVSRYWRKI